MAARYDTIGINYEQLRKPDHRIAGQIKRALGTASTVLNVGAGTGSYEPADRIVTAVEPSIEMIRKRKPSAAPVVQASADNLPFDDQSFDAAMAILTIHHWPDKAAGLREIRRVTRGPIVLLTFDPSHRPWLTEYLPELAALDERQMPEMSHYADWLGPVTIEPVLVCHMIARTVSFTPIGADPKPISTSGSGRGVRHSGRFKAWSQGLRDCRMI